MVVRTPFSLLLRRAFYAFLAVGLFGFVALGLFNWGREQADARQNLSVLSDFLASATQAFFDDLGHGLEPLGQLLQRIDVLNHPEAARPYLEKFRTRYPQIGAMAVIDANGHMLINCLISERRARIWRHLKRRWYQRRCIPLVGRNTVRSSASGVFRFAIPCVMIRAVRSL